MTFSFQSSFWEHYKASVAGSVRSRSGLAWWVGGALLGAFLLLLDVFNIASGRERLADPLVAVGIWFVIGMPIATAWTVWSVRRKNRLVGGQQTFAVGDEGIRISGVLWDGAVQWDAIIRAVETRSFVLFYFAPRFAYYLPKRVVTADDLASLRDLVASRVRSRDGFPTHIDLA